MTKYEQLTMDLIEAVEKAKENGINTHDGGTCNFDSCVLFLPRYNKEKTIQAIREAGISGYKSDFLGRICYMLSNPILAQGEARTTQAETISEIMKTKGYDTTVIYMMD